MVSAMRIAVNFCVSSPPRPWTMLQTLRDFHHTSLPVRCHHDACYLSSCIREQGHPGWHELVPLPELLLLRMHPLPPVLTWPFLTHCLKLRSESPPLEAFPDPTPALRCFMCLPPRPCNSPHTFLSLLLAHVL